MKHILQFTILFVLFPILIKAQNTSTKTIKSASKTTIEMTFIPDDNFEQALIDLGYDSGELNDSVLTEKISGIVSLNITGKKISDLTGIEDFFALRTLNCNQNKLADIDIGKNTNLLYFNCSENQLSVLDVSKNKKLRQLSCYINKISSLDLSQNVALEELHCGYNQLTSIDVSKNLVLYSLSCDNNKISSLDLLKHTAMFSLNCSGTLITNLDLSNNEKLSSLHIVSTPITSLNLSNNKALQLLYCHYSQLTSLDVSNCLKLKTLWCYDNKLTSLNLGTNSVLETLFCENNLLSSLDLDYATALKNLGCSSNQLTSLDVSKNTALLVLWCNNNKLDSLNVGQNATITSINCRENQLRSLNVGQATAITGLYCQDNQLTFEDLEPPISISRFTYSPQDSIGTIISLEKKEGEDLSYHLLVGGDNNLYQWYKNDTVLQDQTSAVLDLTNLTSNDAGIYHCEVTNTVVTGLTLYSRNITIVVNKKNNNPTDIILSKSSIDENKPITSEIGTISTIDEDSGDTFTYSLVPGNGDEDNDIFYISDNIIQSNVSFNYESKNSFKIRLQTKDNSGATLSKSFVILINDVNEIPTDIMLSKSSIDENEPVTSEIGTISTIDEDSGDTFTYSLVPGNGDEDNDIFYISDNIIQSNLSFNYESKNSFKIRLQTKDNSGATLSKSFVILINDVNEIPTDIILSKSSIDENLLTGSIVGIFKTIDEDSMDVYEYSLYSGEGDIDNASFIISNDTLFTNASLDYETKSNMSIRVLASNNQGDAYFKTFSIEIINVYEVGIEAFLNNNIIKVYPNPFSSELNIEFNLNRDETQNIIVYDISGKMIKAFKGRSLEGFNRLIWDATDQNGLKIKSGTYLIHVFSRSQDKFFKIIYNKQD